MTLEHCTSTQYTILTFQAPVVSIYTTVPGEYATGLYTNLTSSINALVVRTLDMIAKWVTLTGLPTEIWKRLFRYFYKWPAIKIQLLWLMF